MDICPKEYRFERRLNTFASTENRAYVQVYPRKDSTSGPTRTSGPSPSPMPSATAHRLTPGKRPLGTWVSARSRAYSVRRCTWHPWSLRCLETQPGGRRSLNAPVNDTALLATSLRHKNTFCLGYLGPARSPEHTLGACGLETPPLEWLWVPVPCLAP